MTKSEVRNLFGKNYIGINELMPFFNKLGLYIQDISEPDINFSDSELLKASSEGYILIYGIDQVGNQPITLSFLRNIFGVNPDISEPCLYNQDWYLSEEFMEITLTRQWYLIKKEVFEDSRSVSSADLIQRGIVFPPAILCAFTFFAYYYVNSEYLWYHDFIWCNDTDHNGDRVYVGKYNDIDGVNKNGFSIHRHLALRYCYGSINVL